MKIFTKICGITNLEDALASIEAGADALGFIFYKKSPRYINPSTASKIIKHITKEIKTVGVFVNESRYNIQEIIMETGINVLQLHGDESPEDCRYSNAEVWKGVRINSESELSTLNKFKVDAFVFDAFHPDIYGGTGTVCDWDIVKVAAKIHKILLSGGLNPENVIDAITRVNPFGVDVNSGVESSPGKKDVRKIKQLFESLKMIEQKGTR